ncbi:50S ribosomal protein L21 [Sulfitobacter sabulilitoris]|uniref:Large ribosomal subunit protein bL21 n=1 Tax=Sulfitobacter sabulilitoris TaxID=2562655 RepID=A0A5S3PJU5_9RHOB|nr:50S ribosomal protein L21 [Sulfitobacter sabulilitoris]TMM54653.1 50S ribosomal protein L21 [Sulfitobacter sabulilitoris]
MFAVLKTGGKQYKVQSGDILRVEKLAAEAGEKVQFNEILMLGGDSPKVGVPFVKDAGVQAEVIDQIKGEKVINFVKRRRKHSSKRTKGHRQKLTLIKVTDILATGADKSGVKAAVGGAGFAVAASDGRYAKNKGEQAEMAKRVSEGEAKEKSAKPAKAKAAPKAAAGADDLKQLSGVGPALEKKLLAEGITTFAQIAAWTDADVADMDEKLSFKGRIEREGWIAQAKELSKS